jgi:uncharacterized protein (UPF0333 family)
MMIRFALKDKRAQALIEYAIVIGAVLAAVAAMQIFNRRATQAVVKASFDKLGNQTEADRRPDSDGVTLESLIVVKNTSNNTIHTSGDSSGNVARISSINETVSQEMPKPSVSLGEFRRKIDGQIMFPEE